jgi:signal transduction histidine kinase
LSGTTGQDDKFEELRKILVREVQRTQEAAHKLADDLTAIGGYAEIMVMRTGEEQTPPELKKVLARAKQSILLLQDCISNLREVQRRYS